MVGAGERDPVGGEGGQPALGGDRGGRVEGVLVLHPVDHRGRVDEVLTAEGDQVVGLGVEPLQPGQVVGDDDLAARVDGSPEVPRRPGAPGPRQQRRVRVQQRDVARVRQRREDLALFGGRLRQHRERLGGVGGDDDGVVRRDLAVAVGDLDAVPGLGDGGDLGADPDVGQPGSHPGDVLVRAAGDRPPLRRAEDAEHAVVLEEREQVAGRVVQGQVGVGRPHGGDERLHEVPGEVRREPAVREEVTQRGVGRDPVRGEQAPRPAVEAWDLGEHPEVRRPQVAAGGEEAARAEGAGVLEAGGVVAHRERHLGLLGGDAELGEQPEQGRVRALVVDDESGVDGQRRAGTTVDEVRVGMAAEPVVGLEERDVRGTGGDVGSGQAGHAAADDGNAAGSCSHQAFSKGIRATGSLVGVSEPSGAGSMVIPAPSASAASPSSMTTASASAGIRPAGTMTPSRFSHSS